MSAFLIALALLFTFGAGACAGWKFSAYLVAGAIRSGRMRELVDEYEALFGESE